MKKAILAILVLTAGIHTQNVQAENVIQINSPTTAVNLMKKTNTRYVIKCVVDLKQKRLTIPSGCTLEFASGGQIVSGYLTGNKTRIEGETDSIFRYTNISGTFDVPQISTRMFEKVTYENALKDVMALANPDVQNTVTIEALPDGQVYKASTEEGRDIVHVPSNTDVVLHGTIKMEGSSEESYSIFCVDGAENVSFSGNGTIIGDRATHTGETGEWGMGINIVGSRNVHVTGLTIRDCWGDCIYVGRSNGVESSNVEIDNCLLTGSRRQGISVVACYGAEMHDLEIRDIRGTDPQAAIDVEPNAGDTCSGAWIRNVTVRNCYLGIIGTTPGDAVSEITDIHIEHCDIESEVLGLNAENCSLFDVKHTSVKAEYSGLRSHISTVKLDSCTFAPYEGKRLESDIIVLWDVYLDARNSEFHGDKFIDNPKATPASKQMMVANNRIFCPVELKMQAGQFIGNTITSDQAPMLSLILGNGNVIRNNTLIYTGEDHPEKLIDVQTTGNSVTNNTLKYLPTGIDMPATGGEKEAAEADVYTMNGQLVRQDVSTRYLNLPPGNYIVGRRKMCIR
ncbi:MAG: right-handed parallel beta-helix repeat-containing protein [Bacteroidaceae bacterium]|nr:right-handed parallel beta-helix repeat-containing protein [Bacteroidaceae bacterium]